MDADDPPLDLASAARELGVHYQTAYRWVRTGRLPALMVDGRYVVARNDVDDLRAARTRPVRPSVPDQRRIAARSGPLRTALLEGDERGVRRIARSLVDEGALVRDLITYVLAPALRKIGEDWRAGRLTIATEHRASAIVERVLGELMPNPRGRRRGTALVAAVEGDHHTLPTTMAAVALREDHWTVHHLGSDMPVAELMSFCRAEPVDLVVLTVTDPSALDAASRAASTIRAFGVPVVVGGPGRTLDELVHEARSVRSGHVSEMR